MQNAPFQQAVVIDTNVLVSTLLFPNSKTAKAVRKALTSFDVYFSQETLGEFLEVIARQKFAKHFLNRESEIAAFIQDLKTLAVFVEITQQVNDCSDPKDNKFLEVALAANALYLITGDKGDLLPMNPYHGIEIITPTDFLNRELKMPIQIELTADQIAALEKLENLTEKNRSELLGLALDRFLENHLTELVPACPDLDSFLATAQQYEQQPAATA